ncbi:hypothetical protein [Pleionea sp. CnH1-48]|uniref:hypothetical protein n=1 Tax=Pleionea sp. CnH1-48 TaxID=2954494 RepID=UPI00209742C4|nr:hypothetical protein [Pleionea sp. CnH1-48]MCO7225136.1 hypothetical protein [Pleionea sp. CnH1-48]
MELLRIQLIRDVQQVLKAQMNLLIYLLLPLPVMIMIIPGLMANMADTNVIFEQRIALFLITLYGLFWLVDLSFKHLHTQQNYQFLRSHGFNKHSIHWSLISLASIIVSPIYFFILLAGIGVVFNDEKELSLLLYTCYLLSSLLIIPVIVYTKPKAWPAIFLLSAGYSFLSTNIAWSIGLSATALAIILLQKLEQQSASFSLQSSRLLLVKPFLRHYIQLVTLSLTALILASLIETSVDIQQGIELLLLTVLLNIHTSRLRYVCLSNQSLGHYFDHICLYRDSILKVNLSIFVSLWMMTLILFLLLSSQSWVLKICVLTNGLISYGIMVQLNRKLSDNVYVISTTWALLATFLSYKLFM